MKALEEKIIAEGTVLSGDVLKVGSFLNQKIDTLFTLRMAEDIAAAFSGESVTKILTMEASGIALGFAVAAKLGVPLVFAKKSKTSNQSGNMLSAPVHSFTHNTDSIATVAAEYLSAKDSILIVDDFLANGEAIRALMSLIAQAGAKLAGCAVAIEKGFQHGGDNLRGMGIHVESLAIIESMSPEEGISFRP